MMLGIVINSLLGIGEGEQIKNMVGMAAWRFITLVSAGVNTGIIPQIASKSLCR
ncbi:hypothetical protein BC941DRAFT_429633 [Chlamydoabsidia padenii]|nr:hypothetical protein BC941DRAFT_429633 [Chlamydoabsidia padenii]